MLAAVLMGLLWTGCLGEAPHDNPLDPRSDDFRNEGALSGTVTDRAEQPLPDVEVRLIPASPGPDEPTAFTTRTGSQGRFRFRDVPAEPRYRLEAWKDGFAHARLDSTGVESGQVVDLPALRLNALPSIEAITLRTVHISRWWPGDLYFAEVSARVSDPDGLVDVDSVWFEISQLDFRAGLIPESGGLFAQQIDEAMLPVPSLSSMLGHALLLRAIDAEGDTASTMPQQFVRVIHETPVAVAPSGDVLTSTDLPLLSWDPLDLNYTFTYQVDVFRDEVNRAIRVLRISDLSNMQTTFQLETALQTGSYYWTVAVVDDFGNVSRSKEAAFRIP